MARQVRKYTKEFKQEAVNLALRSPSISKTATELGIPVPTLHSWIVQLKNQPNISAKKKDINQDMAVLIAENRRLNKELSIAKEEKEILKKAAAFFANEPK